MKVKGGKKGFFGRISASGEPGRAWHPDTGKSPEIVFCDQFSDGPGILSSSGGVYAMPSLNSIEYFA